MSNLVERLDNRFYPEVSGNWDDSLFRSIIKEELTPKCTVLDLGAGAGIVEQMNFKGLAAHVCGIDLDERVVENAYLDEGKVAGGEAIPYPDNSFDLIFSDNVLEHLDHPEAVFLEVARVLKPGGKFFFKTPNKSHYMPLIARMTPHRFHAFVNKLRGREVEDTFPTRYRANSRRCVRKLAEAAGLIVERIALVEGRPEYLRIAAPFYLLGIAYERIVNLSDRFSRFRILLIGILRKPA